MVAVAHWGLLAVDWTTSTTSGISHLHTKICKKFNNTGNENIRLCVRLVLPQLPAWRSIQPWWCSGPALLWTGNRAADYDPASSLRAPLRSAPPPAPKHTHTHTMCWQADSILCLNCCKTLWRDAIGLFILALVFFLWGGGKICLGSTKNKQEIWMYSSNGWFICLMFFFSLSLATWIWPLKLPAVIKHPPHWLAGVLFW